MKLDRDPIVAIATAPGRGAIGIVRASGPDLKPLADALCGRPLPARQAIYGPLRAADGQAIDHGLALYFPAPHSYTGEDVLELQAHGGPVVLQMLLSRCLEAGGTMGLRLARPGEFTERAFLNGRLDLAQAEAVADLIDASTEAAARGAARSLGGALSQAVQALCEQLITLRMHVEAGLDFPEEDLDLLHDADVAGQLQSLAAQLEQLLARARQGVLLREGLHVVIAGEPNAGKSSLLNALAGAERAIVTPIAGTTRDLVREDIQINGVPLHVVDTAGLRESDDPVERIGIERAWAAIAQADVLLLVNDLTRRHDPEFVAARANLAARLAAIVPPGVQQIEVWNKHDLCPGEAGPPDGVTLSARTGEGLEGLRQRLLALAGWQSFPDGAFIARERHVQSLLEVRRSLERAADHLRHQAPPLDLLAEDLRQAQSALNRITGEFGADDLLGVIFSRFCIGK